MVMSNLSDDYHRVFGEHSNIPPCCIEFFIAKFDRTGIPGKWGYVPCAHCVTKGNKIETHSCTYECFDFLVELGRPSKLAMKIIFNNIIVGNTPLGKNAKEEDVYILDYVCGKMPL